MDEQIFTLEEATAGRVPNAEQEARPSSVPEPEPYRPGFKEPETLYSIDQALGVLPESERGPLSRGPSETTGSGLAKGAATAGIRGLAETPVSPGMYGSLRDLVGMGLSYGQSIFSDKTLPQIMRENAKAEEEAYSSPIGQITKKIRVPSGGDIAEKVYEYTGKYEPESEAGKIGQAFTTAAVSGTTPSTKVGAAKQALDIGTRSGLIGAGCAAADVTARYTGSVPLSLAAGVLTPMAGAAIPTMARAHLAPNTLAKDIVGQAGREAARDEKAVRQNLLANDMLPPGMNLTTAEKAGDTGMAALERRLANDASLTPKTGTTKQDVLDQQAANQKAYEGAVSGAASRLSKDQQAAYNLTGYAPREVASEHARNIFSAMEEAADNAVKGMWKVPVLENAGMFRQKIVNQIDEYIASLSPTKRNALSPDIVKTIDDLRNMDKSQIPINFIQDLRSDALAKGRAAFKSGDDTVGGANYALAEELRGILSNDKNFRFLGMRDGKSAPKEWADAVEATRLYHEKYNAGNYLKGLNAKVDPTTNKIPEDATFKALISDPKMAAQNLKQLQNATDGAVNPAFSDFMVASLTNNGREIVKPAKIDAFIGKNAKLIEMTPGLRERLNKIKSAGEANQLSAGIMANMQDPKGLLELLQNNRAQINQLTKGSKADREYFSMLEQAARRMDRLPPDKALPMPTLNRLAEGRTADIIYGIASGRIVSGLAGAASMKAMSVDQLTGYPITTLLAGAVAGNVGRDRFSSINSFIDTVMTGSVRDKAIELLQQARRDPALMASLMQRASPQKMQDLFSISQSGRAATVPATTEGVEEYNKRALRASGGRVSRDIDSAADALIRAAESTKKALGRETESLLNHDDNTIAHALEVANKAI